MFGIKKKEMLSKTDFESAQERNYSLINELAGRERVDEGFSQLEKKQSKQEMMLEELLEQSDQTMDGIKYFTKKMEDLEKFNQTQEKKLLDIIVKYDEFLMQSQKAIVTGIEENQSQMMWKVLDRTLLEGQLGRIVPDHQTVELTQMQVIGIEETEDDRLDHIVKETVIPGWIYKGEMIQKAKVIVWKRKELEHE